VTLVLLGIFIATFSLLLGGYLFANRKTLAAADIARDRLRTPAREVRQWSLLKDERLSGFNLLDRILHGRSWIEALRLRLEKAGVGMHAGTFALLVVMLGAIGMLAGSRFGGSMSLLLTAVGIAAPFLWLSRRNRKRLQKFESQLPDAVDMLVSAMRAGYSFQAATQFIGEEVPDPLGPEFARFYEEQRLGVDVRSALIGMQERVDSLDLKMFVTAVVIQRETGGNLGEVLSNLADLIRSRIALRGHIQTLVAEPKLSAKFLAVMPIVVFFLLVSVNPKFMSPLMNSSLGHLLLAGSAVSVAVGYLIMMKIADVDL
jgi:tight adherence protein B